MSLEVWQTAEWADGEAAMLVVDCLSGRILDANPEAEAFWRQPRAELLQRPVAELLSSRDIQPLLCGHDTCAPIRTVRGHRGRRKCVAGQARVSGMPGGKTCLVTTEFGHPEQPDFEIRRLTWALEAYARSAKALIRARTLPEMAARVCQAIVAHDDYAVATIGLVDPAVDQSVRFIAGAGDALSYVDGLVLSLDEANPEGQGPTGRALRAGTPLVMHDSLRDPIFARWRDRAIRQGIRSSATVPFRSGDDVVGAILVYASRPHIFTDREVQIFVELGEEMGFAMAVLKNRERLEEEREARFRAESELRAKQAEVARIARALTVGEFASTITHEITQPLAAIITNLETAQRFLATDPPKLDMAQAAMQRALRDGDRATNVIRQTRRFVAREEEDFEHHDINAIIELILAFVSPDLHMADFNVTLRLAAGLPQVRCSTVQLQQVLVNLLVNASEAMLEVSDRPGRLEIGTRLSEDGTVLVSITDNGPGMSDEARTRAFEPMYTSKENGMGLGLSISRSIVDAHGGRLWCEPGIPDGTVFHMSLPAVGGEDCDHGR